MAGFRRFLKRKSDGAVFAVEMANIGVNIEKAKHVQVPAVCVHTLKDMVFTPEEEAYGHAMEAQFAAGEFEPVELPCTVASHWLTDIQAAEQSCQNAEREFVSAKEVTKDKKLALDKATDYLRELVVKSNGGQSNTPLLDGVDGVDTSEEPSEF